MARFTQLPLGQTIPDSPHAVSCSLPAMADVRGYEERNPETLARMTSGYPRFVVHPYARRLAALFGKEPDLRGLTVWLTCSGHMAAGLAAHLGTEAGASVFERAGVAGVAHRESPSTSARAKLFLQHAGGFLSSREAEDRLVGAGLLPAAHPERSFEGDAAAEVRLHLRRAMPGAGDPDLLLANSGANAVYSAFRAVSEIQAPRGRTAWVQLGWLYLDTIAVLKKFTPSPGDYLHVNDALDLGALERLLAERGRSVAGLITEVPTNPLIQTPDVPALEALCRRHGILLVLDPSVASPFGIDLLGRADAVVASLTKYTASEGDVIAGLLAVNPRGPHAAELRRRAEAWIEAPYRRDLARLAVEIGRTEQVLARIQENTPKVAAFLQSHPRVAEVFWARQRGSLENFERVARTPRSTGGMISFCLRGIALERFYDRLRLPKGPSFGMANTLICPFMYLAHYDLVGTPQGRAELAENRLDPDLLRLCVGAEPAADIIEALDEALT